MRRYGLVNSVSETGIIEVDLVLKAMSSVCCIESAGGIAFAFCKCPRACPWAFLFRWGHAARIALRGEGGRQGQAAPPRDRPAVGVLPQVPQPDGTLTHRASRGLAGTFQIHARLAVVVNEGLYCLGLTPWKQAQERRLKSALIRFGLGSA